MAPQLSPLFTFSAISTCLTILLFSNPSNAFTPPALLFPPPSPLEVAIAPSEPQPYILRSYSPAQSVAIGTQLYRFPVTGNSSGGSFSLVRTDAPSGNGALGVLPHIHELHYETFYNLKGRFQLWAQKGGVDSGATGYAGPQESRVMLQGDFGAVPLNTTHTFQLLDPGTELVGVIAPGGFEALFFVLGNQTDLETSTPYPPQALNATGPSSAAGPPPSIISELTALDVYAQLSFSPTMNLTNGSASPSSATWHTGPNSLPADSQTPYFLANGFGPIYLNAQHGLYQVVQPLVGPAQSGQTSNTSFTMATLTLSRQFPVNGSADAAGEMEWRLPGASAILVEEGVLGAWVEGQSESVALVRGDVLFVPPQVGFAYWSAAAVSKVLYVGGGNQGLDVQLVGTGQVWEDVTFPAAWP